ncbi:hypothetical protein LBMAG53_38810 [Planctomycetota bacterium]|nr:hypothetical protein LBMAG53_38810 [Planctomycetota bacterium]
MPQTWMLLVGVVYLIMSLAASIAYAIDKRAARRGSPRTSEATLHALELFGGWPGAFLAQRLLHHKNAKLSYQIVFWLIVVLHLIVWAFVVRLA